MIREAVIVVDLGFGDAGKGSVVDYLSDGADWVVRFSGGAQAAHNVVVGEKHHTFSQFGSGTLREVPTYLSAFTLVNPLAMLSEAAQLTDVGVSAPLSLMHVSAECPVTTPFHIAANRVKELARGSARHGSCGLGINETMQDVLKGREVRVSDLKRHDLPLLLREVQERKFQEVQDLLEKIDAQDYAEITDLFKRDAGEDLAEVYSEWMSSVKTLKHSPLKGRVIFEGSQGVLLDQDWGFFPHVTHARTTTQNALSLAREAERVKRVGVLRSYMTRHGAGPFPTESEDLTQRFLEEHNKWGRWEGEWRCGHFDAVLLDYALRICDVDEIALTHLDRQEVGLAATSYTLHGEDYAPKPLKNPDLTLQEIITQDVFSAKANLQEVDIQKVVEERKPISLVSYGADRSQKLVNARV